MLGSGLQAGGLASCAYHRGEVHLGVQHCATMIMPRHASDRRMLHHLARLGSDELTGSQSID